MRGCQPAWGSVGLGLFGFQPGPAGAAAAADGQVCGAGGPEDGGPEDGGPEDGGPEDGGPEDGGPEDGGPEDGGPEDGGPEDGGAP
jgi:hypothetical protein